MPKISIDKTMQDIVHINNQLAGLQMLLDQKKATMAKYFDKTGERSVANDECSVYVQERTHIDYDVDAILELLDQDITDQFVDRTRSVKDWSAFVAMCKRHGITPKELRPYISVSRSVNQEKLSKLYEKGVVSLSDLKGCYTQKVSSVAHEECRQRNPHFRVRTPPQQKCTLLLSYFSTLAYSSQKNCTRLYALFTTTKTHPCR